MTILKIILSKIGLLSVLRYLNYYNPTKLVKAMIAKNAHKLYLEECEKCYSGNKASSKELEKYGVIIEKNALDLSRNRLESIYREFDNVDSIISFDYETGQYIKGRQLGEYHYLNKKTLENLNLHEDFINLEIKKRIESHLGSNLSLYHFSATLVSPNNFVDDGSFIFHRDSQPFCRYKVIVYLTNSLDEDSGPFQYLPGSHKTYSGLPQFGNSRYKDVDRSEVKTCYGKIGDAIVFDNNGIHRGGRTRQGKRIVLTALYTPSKISTRDYYQAYGFRSVNEKEWEIRP